MFRTRGDEMSREIVEAVRELGREKNLESGVLVGALRDGLLAAYKKTPGAYRHATVELDDEGEFRVIAIHMPADLEERLLDDARERALSELERIEEETGERQHTLLSDDDLQLDRDEGPAGHPLAARPRAHSHAVRARGSGDRGRARRDPRRRARARLPLQDRG